MALTSHVPSLLRAIASLISLQTSGRCTVERVKINAGAVAQQQQHILAAQSTCGDLLKLGADSRMQQMQCHCILSDDLQ